jgi:hypothetical protein
MSDTLLSREDFAATVLARNGRKCVVCGASAVDAHHIMERRLFPDGGYYLNNGAALCQEHHLAAEMTLLSVEEIRRACGIPEASRVLPPAYYPDERYDKWGNVIMVNGLRMRGELFDDPSVQKILAEGGVLSQFTHYVKYPRTWHLSWSQNISKDDRVLKSVDHFLREQIVVTIKMDGENITMYNEYLHARSLTNRHHPARSWVKQFHSRIGFNIPKGWRICGENLYAEKGIHYRNLASYYYAFSVWNDRNVCLSWDETVEWLDLLGIVHVPVIYRGTWDENAVKAAYRPAQEGNEAEGYVVRLAKAFHYRNFRTSVAKFVRAGHASRHDFYRQAVIRNELADETE